MPLNDNALNVQGNALAAVVGYISLHSAAPDAAGSNPTTAARVPVTWVVANGDMTMSGGARDFTGGASNGPVHSVGMWDAPVGGTFYGSQPITGDASFNSAGEYTLDSFAWAGA